MREVSVSVDVLCDWQTEVQSYRVYVDNDLLTERTYLWHNPEQYVRENIIVELDSGVHTLTIEPVNPDFTGFSCRNLAVDQQPAPLVNNQFIVN